MENPEKPDVVIFDGNYPAWPWVMRNKNDQLICAFREDGLTEREDSGHGFSPLGKLMVAFSLDKGRTWSMPNTIVDNPGYDDACPAIALLPDGTLLASYYSRLSAGGRSQAWLTRSIDGGYSWEQSVMLSSEDTRVRGALISLSNGDLLVPIYRSMYSENGHVSMTAISEDNGSTWQDGYIQNTTTGELNEWVALEVRPGKIIGLHREESEINRGFFWKTESEDWGRTWNTPQVTNVRSDFSPSPPQLDFHGGRVILTYADSRSLSVSMVTTDDPDYLNWDLENRIHCYNYRTDGLRITDGSYPCSVSTGPTQRLVVDYEIETEIGPEGDRFIDYRTTEERKQITGRFVELPISLLS